MDTRKTVPYSLDMKTWIACLLLALAFFAYEQKTMTGAFPSFHKVLDSIQDAVR